jgi:uncharacterized protein with NAD-binding domain and iron-sulfur cluster
MKATAKIAKPIKVAIVGGGCASTAAAFELTQPHLGGRYQVTIYQLGWRLGGKGASGRGPADRIEEHGLHLWMGFYENAFRLMRECYDELNRDPQRCRIATWTDAFKPDNFNAVADWSQAKGAWLPWKVNFPPLPGMPGDQTGEYRTWTVADYMVRTVTLIRTLFEAIQVRAGSPVQPPEGPGAGPREDQRPATAATVMAAISRLLRMGRLGGLGALLEGLRLLEVALTAVPQYPQGLLLRFQELVAAGVRNQLEALIARDDEARRLWEIADLSLAVVRGALRHGLMTDPRGFDVINDYDCREWLKLNGASQASVNSAFIRALYDLAFAYEDGDERRPGIAAGQALRGAVRAFFTYRGAFFWKMQSGMGDIVFAPLYEVLKRRGVRFEFFHRLENVALGDGETDAPHVKALEFDVQAEPAVAGEYDPLVDVRGLPCWPSEPIWDRLRDGERLRREAVDFESHWDRRRARKKTIRVGADFDLVVLGVSVGAIPHVCKEILARDARWRAMVDRVKTVSTQAFQVWMRDDMKTLGWTEGPINISGFVEPFDTWADMSHLVREESFAEQIREGVREEVRSIAYFCNALPDGEAPPAIDPGGEYHKARTQEVKDNAVRFLQRHVGHLWPRAVDARGRFKWETLVPARATGAPPGDADLGRFSTQYWRANVSPTDRYVLSLPGSLQYRISPLDSSYDNLTICGDWTDCGFNEGCVEAAVMSGRLAAHAISKSPSLEQITGFDHP